MTAIASLISGKSVWIGGDSAISHESGGQIVTTAIPKVWRQGSYVLGWAGLANEGHAVQSTLDLPEPPARGDMDRFAHAEILKAIRLALRNAGFEDPHDLDLLVGFSGRVYSVDCCAGISRVAHEYNAIGSGGQCAMVALAALKRGGPSARLKAALKAVAMHQSDVRPPFTILSV